MNMPNNNNLGFLEPWQQDGLHALKDIAASLEFPTSEDSYATYQQRVMHEMFQTVVSVTTQSAANMVPNMGEAKTVDELDSQLQNAAFCVLLTDWMFGSATQVTALSAAYARHRQANDEFEAARTYGFDLIDHRMRRRAGALAVSTTVLWTSHTGLGEDVSIWHEALEDYEKNRHLKKVVKFSEDEAERNRQFINKALSFNETNIAMPGEKAPSKFRLVNAIRTGRRIQKGLREHQELVAGGTTIVDAELHNLETLKKMMPAPDFSEQEVAEAVRVFRRMDTFMSADARINPRISRDPRRHFFHFLVDHIGTVDKQAERAVFDRDVMKFTKLFQK